MFFAYLACLMGIVDVVVTTCIHQTFDTRRGTPNEFVFTTTCLAWKLHNPQKVLFSSLSWLTWPSSQKKKKTFVLIICKSNVSINNESLFVADAPFSA